MSARITTVGLSTHLRVCSVRKDSKYGWSSGGVADSAVPINSSRTSFGALGASTAIVVVAISDCNSYYELETREGRVDQKLAVFDLVSVDKQE